MKRFLAFLAFAAVALAACDRPTGTAPAGSDTAAAMPDTNAPRDPNTTMTAPDAGATGAVPAAPPPGEAEQPKAPVGEPPR
jgi:hypothetical protein